MPPPIYRPESVHSWWSDRNPPGATIPLHTLAKPLSRFLHRRQVSRIMSQGRGLTISKANADALVRYLEATEISTSTKLLILQYLNARAQREAQAETIAQDYALDALIRLLHSPEDKIVESVCSLLGNLAIWKSVNGAIVDRDASGHLISLATPSDGTPLKQSIYALSSISSWEAGARGLAEAKVQDIAERLLKSGDSNVLQWVCRILGDVARCGHVASATAYTRLKSLEEHPDPYVQKEVVYALSCVRDATESKTSIPDICDDPVQVEYSTRSITERESVHSPELTSGVRAAALESLFSELNCPHPDLIKAAIVEIEQLSDSALGFQALCHPNRLRQSSTMLEHDDPAIWDSACQIFANLGRSPHRPKEVVKLLPLTILLSFLRHPNTSRALKVLLEVSEWEVGVLALCTPKLLPQFSTLLEDDDPWNRESAWQNLDNLGRSPHLPKRVIDLLPLMMCCEALGSLLNSTDPRMVEGAIAEIKQLSDSAPALRNWNGLRHICDVCRSWWRTPDDPDGVLEHACRIFDNVGRSSEIGAKLLCTPKLLPPIFTLLGHDNPVMLESACRIFANLTRSPHLRKTVVKLLPVNHLLSLLRKLDTSRALKGLIKLSDSSLGAPALFTPNLLQQIFTLFERDNPAMLKSASRILANLLKSPDLKTVQSCCNILGHLAQAIDLHGAIVESGGCVTLSSLLGRSDCTDEALHVCMSLSVSEIGARALVNTDYLLDRVAWMLYRPGLQEPVCRMLGNIARWPSLRKTVMQLHLGETLTHILSESRSEDRGSLHEAAEYALRNIVGGPQSVVFGVNWPSLTDIQEEQESR
ncbi:armadillo-type protein [Mycena latifolia]|nr:armadillo-type protein [Mycena latifolia]